jgi:hypothetical protein
MAKGKARNRCTASEKKKYLKEVWGFDNVRDMDAMTFHAILENTELAKEFGKDWDCDFALVDDYFKLHPKIPRGITSEQFWKKYVDRRY